MNHPRLRPAVRGLVIDDSGSVLLVRLSFPHGAFWVLPGGGIDGAEDHMDALCRELSEETGLADAPIGPAVWHRTHHFDFLDTDGVSWEGQTETVYLVRTPRFDIRPSFTQDQLLSENLDGHRWWSVDELRNHTGPDHLSPPDLGSYVHSVINDGVPATPFVITHRS
jgi:8-oxo-dGTP pyrophosphatase MutT (NUDIX family)